MKEIVDRIRDIKLNPQILEFIKNRYKKGETTASRHIHIRFDIEIEQAEEVLDNLAKLGKISKSYDEEFQEFRYS